MPATLTLSNVQTDGSTLSATLAGVVATHTDYTIALQAENGSLPDGDYKLELYDATKTLLASTDDAGGTAITVTAGVGAGVLSTRTTQAQAAVANAQRVPAVLVLYDDDALYAPARLAVTLWRNEAGEAAVTLDGTIATVSQAEAEAGTVTTVRHWPPLRVAQAIAALETPDVTTASQAEMEAGTEAGLRLVSPLRIAQAITALAGGGGDLSQSDIDTLAELNAILTDATLIDTADSRLSDDRDPTAHAAEHTDGTDDIQSATASQKGLATAAQISKLDGLESGATADQTDAEILAAVESESGRDMSADGTKLDGIEASATADQTGAEIKTAYEAEADTNAYDDAAVAKLAAIETSATADQTGAEIKAAYEAEADTNAFTDADHTKLDGIEAAATADQSDAEIQTAYEAQVAAASQAEMEAGTEAGTRRMSPLRIAQAIAALAAGGLSSSDIDTLAELNAILTDATLIDTADSRLSDARTPTAHANDHTDGTDDIQDATASVKGLATAAQIAKLDGIETGADVTDAVNIAAAGAPIITSGAGAPVSTPAAVGDIYVDTTGDNVWQAAGTASSADWKQATGAGGGDLLAANNLSDLANAGTGRTNLGVAIGSDVQAYSAVLDATTASFTTADETKLDGIEASATADQTGAEIKAAYEAEADTNAFTDADHTKLDGIETAATADQTAADIQALVPQQLRAVFPDPATLYGIDTDYCLWTDTPAALTINAIKVTCNADPTTELDWNLYFADDFISKANATLIRAMDTTAGVLDVSTGWNDNTVPAGKCIYVAFDATPDAALLQVAFQAEYTYD